MNQIFEYLFLCPINAIQEMLIGIFISLNHKAVFANLSDYTIAFSCVISGGLDFFLYVYHNYYYIKKVNMDVQEN